MNPKAIAATIAGVLSLALLTGCGNGDVAPPAAPTTSSTSTTITTAAPTTTLTETPEATPADPEPTAQPVVVNAPVIISCDGGPGPVITYWSDGTVTGSTPYCEDVAESRRQAERDHNGGNWKSPVTSPEPISGINESYGQTHEVPGLEDVEFICGYNVLCDNAGNVIPSPSLQDPVLLGNGHTCAGNGCTRPY